MRGENRTAELDYTSRGMNRYSLPMAKVGSQSAFRSGETDDGLTGEFRCSQSYAERAHLCLATMGTNNLHKRNKYGDGQV
jgi:hypothetical protein